MSTQAPNSAAELRALAGGGSLETPKLQAQALVFDFAGVSSTAIGQASVRIDGSRDFYVDAFAGWPVLSALSGASIAGTPLLAEASPTIGNNTFYSAWPITLDIQIGNLKVSNKPFPVPTLVQPGIALSYPQLGLVFPRGQTIQMFLDMTALAGPSVNFKFTCWGRYLRD